MNFQVEKDWVTESGLRAVVVMTTSGHRCGYVGLPESHPLHGVPYSAQTPNLKPNMERTIEKMSPILVFAAALRGSDEELNTPEYVFEVHGGLTYSGKGDYPVESDLWWFGYDCAHHGDRPEPGYEMSKYYSPSDGEVRTLDYCVGECESLAGQISKVVLS